MALTGRGGFVCQIGIARFPIGPNGSSLAPLGGAPWNVFHRPKEAAEATIGLARGQATETIGAGRLVKSSYVDLSGVQSERIALAFCGRRPASAFMVSIARATARMLVKLFRSWCAIFSTLGVLLGGFLDSLRGILHPSILPACSECTLRIWLIFPAFPSLNPGGASRCGQGCDLSQEAHMRDRIESSCGRMSSSPHRSICQRRTTSLPADLIGMETNSTDAATERPGNRRLRDWQLIKCHRAPSLPPRGLSASIRADDPPPWICVSDVSSNAFAACFDLSVCSRVHMCPSESPNLPHLPASGRPGCAASRGRPLLTAGSAGSRTPLIPANLAAESG